MAAHADDEVLGCGATLVKHAVAGDHVTVAIFIDRDLHEQATSAALVLGTTVWLMDFPDQKLDTVPFLALSRELEIADFKPDIIYTHWPYDLNLDHELVARATLTAFRPKPGTRPRTILAYETLSSTEWSFGRSPFAPNWFVDLSGEHYDCLAKKIRALECYASELRDPPHPRNVFGVTGLAEQRGSQCGVTYAEAFALLRRGPC